MGLLGLLSPLGPGGIQFAVIQMHLTGHTDDLEKDMPWRASVEQVASVMGNAVTL